MAFVTAAALAGLVTAGTLKAQTDTKSGADFLKKTTSEVDDAAIQANEA